MLRQNLPVGLLSLGLGFQEKFESLAIWSRKLRMVQSQYQWAILVGAQMTRVLIEMWTGRL